MAERFLKGGVKFNKEPQKSIKNGEETLQQHGCFGVLSGRRKRKDSHGSDKNPD